MVTTDGETGRRSDLAKRFPYVIYGKSVTSAQKRRICLSLGLGTVLRLERDAW